MTTTNRRLRLHVEVEPDTSNGLDRTSFIQCELVRAVSRRRLVRQLGRIDRTAGDRVGEVVRSLLGY